METSGVWGGLLKKPVVLSRGAVMIKALIYSQESDITAKAGHLGGLRKKDKKNS